MREQRGDIPATMQSSYDRQRLGGWIIDNHIGEDGPELYRRIRQVSATMASFRYILKELQSKANAGKHIADE
jgi:hypothetical protein